MKARLAYLCSSESWGGLEMNHLRNALWMQDRGHDVVVLCLENSRFYKEAKSAGLKILSIQKHKKYYDFKNGSVLVKILKSEKITHLLIRSTRDMSITSFAKSKLGDQLHTSYFMEMQLGVKKTNVLHTLRFRGIDLWSCPLPWLENQVRTMTKYRNELVVIPSGIDLKDFESVGNMESCRKELDLPSDKMLFGLMGRFDVQKGQLLLLEAINLAKNDNFHVVLLGEPTFGEGAAYHKQMQDFIQSNHLENRVHIRPFMKNPQVFYAAIDWFVMATKAETFGMVTIESLACGTPVLGSNAGGTPEILEHEKGGLLFNSLDAEDLARKMDRICEDKLHIPSETLKEMARKYDHNEVCKQVEKSLGLNVDNETA